MQEKNKQELKQEAMEQALKIVGEAFTPKDIKFLTKKQIKGFHNIAAIIFFDLRDLLLSEKYDQATDLINCFHNVFLFIDKKFSFDRLKRDIEIYNTKYPDGVIPYLDLIKEIEQS